MVCEVCGDEIGNTDVVYREGVTLIPCCDECWALGVVSYNGIEKSGGRCNEVYRPAV